VEARALVRRFGSTAVLAGLDVTVRAGEVVGVFGPNGAGKTTLVRILATLLAPTAGTVHLFGEDAFAPSAARLRRRLGLVTHESFLYPDLTAVENLLFYARLYGVQDPIARADAFVKWAGLDVHGSRPVRTYSRGMTQRLSLARALLHGPDLLVLDEPFSGLDAAATHAVENVLQEVRREGRTALLTTHDVVRGLRIADRVYILNRGRIAWESAGPTEPGVFSAAYRRVVGEA
jgi:ABC-type multidrug transport system ATPase subunit